LIVALLLTQMALLSITGAALGTGGALIALTLIGDPLPGLPFVAAVAVLATAVGLVAALAPALAAATRDPIRELRVP
jgi:putative ABC transport system permease protein